MPMLNGLLIPGLMSFRPLYNKLLSLPIILTSNFILLKKPLVILLHKLLLVKRYPLISFPRQKIQLVNSDKLQSTLNLQ